MKICKNVLGVMKSQEKTIHTKRGNGYDPQIKEMSLGIPGEDRLKIMATDVGNDR